MKQDKKHPKLTAYVLNEVSEKERKKIDKLLKEDIELQAEVDEMRELASMLEQGFQSEESPVLDSIRSHRIMNIPKAFEAKKKTYWIAGAFIAPAIAMVFMFLNNSQDILNTPSVDTLWLEDTTTRDQGEVVAVDQEVQSEPSLASPAAKPKLETSGKGNLSNLGYGVGAVKSKPVPLGGYPDTKRLRRAGSGGTAPKKRVMPSPAERRPSGAQGSQVYGDAWLPSESPVAANKYTHFVENDFLQVSVNPLSTFSIDVDTASYSVIRQYLNRNQLPPADAVRLEEMMNYFDYQYAAPQGRHPFAVHTEVANSPWKEGHRLVRIALKGKDIAADQKKPSNLVFLLDVSGSMNSYNKLPLLKRSFKKLIANLQQDDTISIVVYAGASGVVLEPTKVRNQEKIFEALGRLKAGGSTNGGSGLALAYKKAYENLLEEGNNRVILATDGDFNVGTTGHTDLVSMVRKYSESNIFLTVLGFGLGNYKDDLLEAIANKGNGNYFYIDSDREAQKVLGQQLTGTLVTIAKDVKIQVEFNPEMVQAYRLLGYENRRLNAEDFNNDKKDAGEIGAGHAVTAIYEVVPVGVSFVQPGVDPLKYQKPKSKGITDLFKKKNSELMTVKLRYKEPKGKKSKLLSRVVKDSGKNFSEASEDFRFASSVAAFGMILRGSQYKGSAKMSHVLKSSQNSMSHDPHGYKAEFLDLVKKASRLKK